MDFSVKLVVFHTVTRFQEFYAEVKENRILQWYHTAF